MSQAPITPEARARALALIRAEVSASSKAAVAMRLGYSRPAVSRLLSGTYGDPDQLLRTALTVLDSVGCPHTGVEVPRTLCVEQTRSEPPTHNPFRLAHWHACRRCPNNPTHQEVQP